MPLDLEIRDANRAATERIRAFERLTDRELRRPVGQHWTVAILLAHLAFWDRRALDTLDRTEQAGAVTSPDVDVVANDLSLPLWAAIPPRDAVRLAIEAAEALDRRLEVYPAELVAAVLVARPRWIRRHLHRNEHLDEADAALPA